MPRKKITAAPGIPAAPPHLAGEARAEWDRLVPILMERELFISLDVNTLAAYCTAWARHIDAEAKLQETGGPVVKSPSGFPIQNPYLAISNAAVKQLNRLLAEFGLSPASRARLLNSEAEPQDDDADDPVPAASGPLRVVGRQVRRDRSGDDYEFTCAVCRGKQAVTVPFSDKTTACPSCDAPIQLGRNRKGELCLKMRKPIA